VQILSDLKLNHDEPVEEDAIRMGNAEVDANKDAVENKGAVEMLRAIPGVGGHNIRYVTGKVGSLREFVDLKRRGMEAILGTEAGERAYAFVNHDLRDDRRASKAYVEAMRRNHGRVPPVFRKKDNPELLARLEASKELLRKRKLAEDGI
jgi:ERCC4-type nuclease